MVRGRKNPLHFGFGARLKRARKRAGYTRVGLATQAGLTDREAVAALETSGRTPRLDTVTSLAAALGMSPAALAYGLDEAAPADTPQESTPATVGARLRTARLACGLSALALGKASATSDTTVRLTENGDTMPSIATSEALAIALDVSPAWIAFGVGPKVLPTRRTVRTAQPDARG